MSEMDALSTLLRKYVYQIAGSYHGYAKSVYSVPSNYEKKNIHIFCDKTASVNIRMAQNDPKPCCLSPFTHWEIVNCKSHCCRDTKGNFACVLGSWSRYSAHNSVLVVGLDVISRIVSIRECVFRTVGSLWNLTTVSPALLPRCAPLAFQSVTII